MCRLSIRLVLCGSLAVLLSLGGCSSSDEPGCVYDDQCPQGQLCRNGQCLAAGCTDGCPAGQWCEGEACVACADDEHCGPDCVDCAAADSDRACVEGACGCATDGDCALGEACQGGQCAADGCAGVDCPAGQHCTDGFCYPDDCVPDCAGKQCGPDGCGGSCGGCAEGQHCADGACEPAAEGCDQVGAEAFFGCYYDAIDFTELAFTRTDAAIDFDFGYGSPDPAMDADGFSILWRGDFDFEAGSYDFSIHTDDGVRLYVDGQLVLDEWREQEADFQATLELAAGTHRLEVAYYEDQWGAAITVGWAAHQEGSQTQTYTEDETTDFLNPERGWYVEDEFSNQGQRLSMRYVRMDDYRASALPQSFLDDLAAEMAGWRATGTKAVLRFAYNRGPADDAPLAIVLQHIGQLAPLLAEHQDVIAVLQAGFIGYWGEWHDSSNGLITDVAARNQILDALLAAAPDTRMVQFRTPWMMEVRYPTAVGEDQRFDGSAQARMGFHNDCFLTDETDTGTYSPWDGSQDVAEQRLYGQAVGRVAAVGGETCDMGGLSSYNDCAQALAEMEAFGWDYLNSEYWTPMIDKWRDQGCYDEISRRLGYRFVLDQASAPREVAAGGPMRLSLTVRNVGFGKLYNPRPLQVVFSGPGGPLAVTALADCRRQMPLGGQTETIELRFDAPAGLVTGQVYALSLGLPDASAALAGDVRHMVRLADVGTWDEASGLNELGLSVTAR